MPSGQILHRGQRVVPPVEFLHDPVRGHQRDLDHPVQHCRCRLPRVQLLRENASASEDLLYDSSKYIMALLLPLIVFLFMFSEEILLLWQGAEVARNSAGVLRILLLGVFINSINWVPVNMLTGQGRPDIVAKIHMAQIPLYIVVAYFSIGNIRLAALRSRSRCA